MTSDRTIRPHLRIRRDKSSDPATNTTLEFLHNLKTLSSFPGKYGYCQYRSAIEGFSVADSMYLVLRA